MRIHPAIELFAGFLVAMSLNVASCEVFADDGGIDFFEKHVRPILVKHCYECHSATSLQVQGELRLDFRDGLLKGGESGPAIVPGKPEESLLLEAVRYESIEMPPSGKLPESAIADITKWIEIGTPDPRDQPPSADEVAELSWRSILGERRGWWSLQPVTSVDPPIKKDESWSDHPVDRFLWAARRETGIVPAKPADGATLLRRLTLVLTGLPPTPAEIDRFLGEFSRDPHRAYDRLVDRLLDSPHFGERWARHWMDVVRFAETHGYEWNHEIRDAWRYRDYLIRAFNADVPYDQLVREHIAGDLLPYPRMNVDLDINESMIGTAFWRFGELGHDDCVQFPEIRYDALDNQIDTFSKAFQGLTISCARCHDHKLDAISTKDYYALVGILESSSQVICTIDRPQRIADLSHELRQIKESIRRQLATLWLNAIEDTDDELLEAFAAVGGESKQSDPLVKRLSNDKLGREDPGYVLRRFACLDADEDVRQRWADLKQEYELEQQQRAGSNAEKYERWCDVQAATQNGCSISGLGLTGGPSHAGAFTIAHAGDRVVSAVLPAGLYTNILSARLNGSLRLPWMPTGKKYVSVQLVGDGLSMVRTVVDSCALNEFAGGGLEYLDGGITQWKTFPTSAGQSHRSYVELTTKSDNPRWPDRPGRAGTKDDKKLASRQSSFGVMRVVLHDHPEPPAADLSSMLTLFEQPDPDCVRNLAANVQEVARRAILSWKNDMASDSEVRWINWMLDVGLLPNSATSNVRLAVLTAQYRAVEARIPTPRVVAGLADHGQGISSPTLLGGDPRKPGPLVARRYIEVLTGPSHEFGAAGSGRYALANLIASENNPLTARVMVNRIWHHLFGRGIVSTPDDFGLMGERPTHPQLLDYLSSEFMRNGWSIKKFMRLIVTSEAFRQASVATEFAMQRDPNNLLLHHYPARRLDAEAIRDTILAVSGRLDRGLFGTSVHPHRNKNNADRKLAIGPLDGNGRRSIYIKVTRMEGPKFLELFDLPGPMATRGRRDVTNVPAQALALLNDPFIIDQSRYWAKQLVTQDDSSVEHRVDRMFLRATGRPPTEIQQQRFVTLILHLDESHSTDVDVVLGNQRVWQDAAHAIFNMKELIYVW